jgi:RecA-family ATPase
MKAADANDILRAYGADGLRAALDTAPPIDLDYVPDGPDYGERIEADTRGELQGEEALPELEIVNAASFAGKNAPHREWLVRGLIPAHDITMLYGDGGAGKSLLALQLAVAVVTETEWVGTFPAGGGALFLSAEDEIEELHRRLEAIVRAQGLHMGDLGKLDIIPLAGKDATLASQSRHDGPMTPTRLYKAIHATIQASRPDLLVLDTVADLFDGDEIKRKQVRQFIGLLRALALQFRVTILLLAHPSQAGMAAGTGTSGNTAWNNSVRSRLYFATPRKKKGDDDEGDPDTRVLTNMKLNYGRKGDERVLRWRDGVFVLDAGARPEKLQTDAEDDRTFLDLLAEFARSEREVSDKTSNAYAPAKFAEHPSAKGLSKGRLTAAMNRLFKANRIHIENSGPPSKRRSRIVSGPPPALNWHENKE